MDPYIHEYARAIIDRFTGVEAGGNVVVSTPSMAENPVTVIYEPLDDHGASVVATGASPWFTRALLRAGDDNYETSEHVLALYEETDITVHAYGETNTTEQSDAPPKTNAAYKRTYKPVQSEILSKRQCLTQYPVKRGAQLAGMSTEVYENFVYDAVTFDWDAQDELRQQSVNILNDGDEIRITLGDETDMTMSIAGSTVINGTTEYNLPGDEMFTTPVRDSVNGEVHFDLPLCRQGREVSSVRVRFRDDEVADYSVEGSEEVLDGVLDTNEDTRYPDKLGTGMNCSIDQFTYNILFDERIDGTIHMAAGSAYLETVSTDNELNESIGHVDVAADMPEDSVTEVDDEATQRDGTFILKDGL